MMFGSTKSEHNEKKRKAKRTVRRWRILQWEKIKVEQRKYSHLTINIIVILCSRYVDYMRRKTRSVRRCPQSALTASRLQTDVLTISELQGRSDLIRDVASCAQLLSVQVCFLLIVAINKKQLPTDQLDWSVGNCSVAAHTSAYSIRGPYAVDSIRGPVLEQTHCRDEPRTTWSTITMNHLKKRWI